MIIFHPLLCYYPSQAGGPANSLYWINNNLNKSVFSARVISTDFGINAKDFKPQIEFNENHNATFLRSKGLKFVSIGYYELKKCDIVQFSSLFFPPTLVLLALARLKNKIIIISPRGELYPSALNKGKAKKTIWLSILKIFQRRIHFHATNDIEFEMIKSFFPKSMSITTIPNHIELSEKREVKSNRKQVLFLGRINPIKNLHLLIDAVYSLAEKFPDIRLIIAGKAQTEYELNYLRQLEDFVQKNNLETNISFVGHIKGDEKMDLIASSGVLVLPSQSENFGNVVIEALSQGTPVIASTNTPWKDLESYKCGSWINAKTENIYNSLEDLILLPFEEYILMRENAYKLCVSKYDIKKNISSWENFYNKITHV